MSDNHDLSIKLADQTFLKLAQQAEPTRKLMANNEAFLKLSQQAEPMRKFMIGNEALFLNLAQQAEPMRRLMANNEAFLNLAQQAEPMRNLMANNEAFLKLAQQAEPMRKIMAGNEALLLKLVQQAEPMRKFFATAEALAKLVPHIPPAQAFSANISAKMVRRFAVLAAEKSVVDVVTPADSVNFEPLSRSLDKLSQDLLQNGSTPELIALFANIFDALLRLLDAASAGLETRVVSKMIELLLPMLFALWLALSSDHNVQMVGASIREDMHQGQVAIEQTIAHEGEQEHSDVAETNRKLDKLIELLAAKADATQGEFYRVVRAVPLCKDKKYRGARLAILFPATEVEVLRHAGKWLLVRVLMHPGEIREGWVLKKYMQKVT